MNKLICTLLSLMLYLSIFTFNADALPENPAITAESAILIDSERGQVLYQKNKDTKLSISLASKIMTIIVALEKGDINSTVTISKEALNTTGPTAELQAGEKLPLIDLLYAVLMTSSNDAANVVAEYIGGSIDKFVDMMNSKASNLNMKNTYFTSPTGLYDQNQYSTASDIAILLEYSLKNQQFKDIFSTKGRPWSSETGHTVLINQNKMFWLYDGVEGGCYSLNNKTLQSSATLAVKDGMGLIAIVLKSSEQNIFNDTIALFDYGFENFRRDILVPGNTPLKSVTIGAKQVNLVSMEDVYYIFPVGKDFIKQISINVNKDIKPPVSRTNIIGTARYTLGDGTIIDINLYPDTDVPSPVNTISFIKGKLLENREIAIVLTLLLAVEILLILQKCFLILRKVLFK